MKSEYTDYLVGILIGIALMNLWYLSSLAIENKILPTSYGVILDVFKAGFGAFLGAYLAFKYNNRLEDRKNLTANKKKDDENISRINAELLKLALLLNSIGNYLRAYEKYSVYERAFSMRAEKWHGKVEYVDIPELVLILSENIVLLFELGIFQEGINNTIESIEVRNTYYINTVQAQMSKYNLLDTLVNIDEVKNKLGFGVYKAAIDSVETAYQNIKNSSEEGAVFADKLWKAAKSKYPSAAFIKPIS